MEKAYKIALEIILNMCKKENYMNTENIKLVCETVLKNDTDGLNQAIRDAACIANGGGKNV